MGESRDEHKPLEMVLCRSLSRRDAETGNSQEARSDYLLSDCAVLIVLRTSKIVLMLDGDQAEELRGKINSGNFLPLLLQKIKFNFFVLYAFW